MSIVRSTPRDTGRRVLVSDARGIVTKTDDEKKLQELEIALLADENMTEVERFQQYGLTSYPKKPGNDPNSGDQQDGQQPGGGGQQQQQKDDDKAAELIIMFVGGERTHAVVLNVDDRRFRLINLQEGEVALYDDQKQKVHIKRDMIETRTHKKQFFEVIEKQPKKNDEKKNDQEAKKLSWILMEQDKITIERTNKNGELLSRVMLEEKKITIDTPSTSIVLDENKKYVTTTAEKRTLTETPKTSVMCDEDNGKEQVVAQTTTLTALIDEKEKKIKLLTPKTAVVCDDNAALVRVGEEGASIPLALKGDVTSNGERIVGPCCKKAVGK